MCSACGDRTSVTAGTIFDRTRTPLTVWFTACWLFATAKDGVSALGLKRVLEIGSYQTAWAMLHRLRPLAKLGYNHELRSQRAARAAGDDPNKPHVPPAMIPTSLTCRRR